MTRDVLAALASNPSCRSNKIEEQTAATLKLRILTVAAAASAVASSLVGTASAAEGPAPAPMSSASLSVPALAAAFFTALVFGYLFLTSLTAHTALCKIVCLLQFFVLFSRVLVLCNYVFIFLIMIMNLVITTWIYVCIESCSLVLLHC
jgi:hypothetical protein